MENEVEMSCDGQLCYDTFVKNSARFQFMLMDLDAGYSLLMVDIMLISK
jgi:hypothetical protein